MKKKDTGKNKRMLELLEELGKMKVEEERQKEVEITKMKEWLDTSKLNLTYIG